MGLKYGYTSIRMDLLTVKVMRGTEELDTFYVLDVEEAKRSIEMLCSVYPDVTDINIGTAEGSIVSLWKNI